MRRCIWLAASLLATFTAAGAAHGAEIAAARQAELRNLLVQDCGACHGSTLKGGLGPSLLPQALSGRPDRLLVDAILDGRPGTAMPPWRPFLSQAEVKWLVRQLRHGLGDEQ